MTEVSKISGTVGLNTAEFKKNIADMNRDIRLLESGFRAGAAGFVNWKNDATALEGRIKTLNEQIDIQKNKVALLTAEYQRVVAAEGANSAAAQDMQFKVNGATKDLNRMQTELGQDEKALVVVKGTSGETAAAMAIMGLAVDGAAIAFAGLKDMVQGVILVFQALIVVMQVEFAAALAVLEVGIGAVLGLGAVAVIAGIALGGLTFKAAYAADQLGEMSVKTGISVERLQELGFIGKVVGTDIDTLATANARLVKNMYAAQGGTSAAAKAFKQLGVAVTDSSGNLRDSDVVFGEAIDALGKVSNETEQAALAQAIFGRGAQELLPLIKLGSKGLADMAAEAHKLGAIVSTETIATLGALQDQLDMLTMGLKGVGTQILVAFAPFFSGMLGTAIGYLEQLVAIVQGSGGDFGKMAEGMTKLFTTIITDIANNAPAMFAAGLKIIKVLIDALLASMPAILTAAVSIVQTLANFIIQNLPMLASTGLTVMMALVQAIVPQLPLLFSVGLQIIEMLIGGLVQAIPTLLPMLATTGMNIIQQLLVGAVQALPALIALAPQIINTLINFLYSNLTMLIAVGIPLISQLIQAILPALPMLVSAALLILVALANGIAQQMPVLVPVITQVVVQLIEVLALNAPLLIQAAFTLMTALVNGFAAASPMFWAQAPLLVMMLFIGFMNSLGMLVQGGLMMMGAVLQGWVSDVPLLLAQSAETVNQMLATLRGKLGQFEEIGKNIVQGIWKGIQSLAGWLYAQVTQFAKNIAAQAQAALGIQSPSKVFGEIGKMSVLGFSEEFFRGLDELQKQANAAMRGFAGTVAVQAGGFGGSVSNSSENIGPFYAPVIIQGSTPAGSLGARLKARTY